MKQRHVKVPYQLIELAISNEAKNIYIVLMYFRSGSKRNIHVSLEKISEIAGLKERQLKTHMKTLVKHGILARKQNNYGNGEYGCNVYTIKCVERYFVELHWDIAFNAKLTAFSKIAYCIMKQHINLNKMDFTCYLEKKDLAKYLDCSLNQVDKVKRSLIENGFIECERNSNKIVLVYEMNI